MLPAFPLRSPRPTSRQPALPCCCGWRRPPRRPTRPLRKAQARAAIDKFGPTQWTGEAFLRLGDFAFERRDWKQAETAFNKAIRNSPMNTTAARATIRLGDAQFAQAHYEEAIKRYQEVQCRSRNGRENCRPKHFIWSAKASGLRGKKKETYTFFQRIYVLYPHYKEWTAKAYLRCAEISEKLGLKDDAMRTLGEMLANQSLRSTLKYKLSAGNQLKELQ